MPVLGEDRCGDAVDPVEVLTLVQGVAKGADAFDLRGEVALRGDCLFRVLLELQTGEEVVLVGVGEEGEDCLAGCRTVERGEAA